MNLIIAVRVAEFGEFRLQQRVVARVVHEAEMIFKFRVEADDENIFLERHRMRVHKIAARERADPAHGFDKLRPQDPTRSPETGAATSASVAAQMAAARRAPARRVSAGSLFRNGPGWCPAFAAQDGTWSSCGRRGYNACAALAGAQLVQLFQHGVERQGVARFDGAEQR